MARDSSSIENKQFSERVSAGRGPEFADMRGHAGPESKDANCRYTDVNVDKQRLSDVSVYRWTKGRKNERKMRGR